MGSLGYISISLTYIQLILQICLYMAAITLSFKGVQTLNIYINKNSK